jgi:hypothetical protein
MAPRGLGDPSARRGPYPGIPGLRTDRETSVELVQKKRIIPCEVLRPLAGRPNGPGPCDLPKDAPLGLHTCRASDSILKRL